MSFREGRTTTWLCAVLGWIAVAFSAASAPAEQDADANWSRFRGPNGSGIALGPTFPSQWTQADYRIPLSGVGHSSPVGWNDLIFVTSGDAENATFVLQALDAATGKEAWSRTFQNAPHSMHRSNSYASSSPVVDERRVYVMWAAPEAHQVAAVDHQGEIVWRKEFDGFEANHGFGGSPVLIEGLLIVPSDHLGASSVFALDPATGDVVWRTPRGSGKASYGTPVVWRSKTGEPQIILDSLADGVAGVSPADGSTIWQTPNVFPQRCVASPIVAGGLVFGGCGSGSNGTTFVCVRPAEEPGEQAKVVKSLTQSIPQVPTPIAVGDLLFIWHDRGVVSCLDVATQESHWIKRVGGNFYGSPICAGGKLYCLSREGDAIVLAANSEYELLGRNSLGETSHATPIVHGDRMYIRTETSLACLAPEKP